MPSPALPEHPPWLNAKRLRAQGLMLAIVLWGVYAWVLATSGMHDRNHLIKGTDFIHFYTLGTIALEHRGDLLYDMQGQAELLSKHIPQARGTRYLPLYGPQMSLLFAPFAKLPYLCALAVWWLVTSAIYAGCVWAVWRNCPALRGYGGTVFILALGYPAVFHLIAWGQTSALALACFTAMYLSLKRGRSFAAGLALGLLVFKPQLGLAAAVIFLVSGEARVLMGAGLAAAAELAIGWLYYGTPTMRDYVQHLINIPSVMRELEPRPYQTHCLRTFWEMLVPGPSAAFALYLVSAIVVLVLACRCWRSERPLGMRFSLLLLATVLVSPHLTVYDLAVLAPALLLLADWLIANPKHLEEKVIAILSWLVYWLPLIGPVTRWTHVQVSVIAMFGLLWSIARISRSEKQVLHRA